MPIKLTFELTRSDVIRLWYLAMLNWRRRTPIVMAVFFVAVPWIAACVFLSDPSVGRLTIVGLFSVPLVLLVLYSMAPLLAMYRMRSPGGPYTYEFSDEGMNLAGQGIESRMEWKLVSRCHGAPMGLLVFYGENAFLPIPGRAASPEVRKQLRELLLRRGIPFTGAW